MSEKNILIADDEEIIRTLLVQMLKDEGYRFFLSSNGKEAVEITKNNPIDLAILDIKMPEMDGIEALKRIKEIEKNIEVLIMTGYADLEGLKQVMEDYGAFDYLLKPFNRTDIIPAIQKALLKRELVLRNHFVIEELKNRILQLENDFKEKTLQLRESQIKYKNIVESSNDMIIVAQDGNLKFANPKALELTGYTREEIKGMPFIELVHPDDHAMVAEWHMRQLQEKDTSPVRTFRLLRKDGKPFWVESNSVETTWEGTTARLNIIRDITDQKQMKEVIMRSEKLSSLGRLAAGLAHELRNPLAVISSCAQFCIENMQLARTVNENLQMIYLNSQRASSLIRDLLSFAGPSHFEWKEVDVNVVVARMWEMVKLEVPRSRVIFVPQLEKRLPRIVGDEEKLGQVFLNLLLNAIQVTSIKGKIIIQTQLLPQNEVEVNVIDDGPGIPEDYRDRIFDPFFTTKDGGTGLGLSICHTIVQQHKGSITAECNDDRGTKVCVRLPVSQ